MKKILLTTSILLAIIIGVISTGCSATIHYSFSAYWQKNKVYTSTYKEELSYDINYLSEYKETSNNVTYEFKTEKNDKAEYTYSKGSYTIKVEAIKTLPSSLEKPEEGEYYKLSTEFSLPVTYVIKEEDNKSYSFTDKITSVVYFRSVQKSLSPIYSEKFFDNTILNGGNITRYSYQTIINWDTKAQLSVIDKSTEINDDIAVSDHYKIKSVSSKDYSVKYKEGTVLDNEELLFASRGLSFSDKFSTNMKIYDTAYPSAFENVTISCYKTVVLQSPWTLKINNDDEISNQKSSTFFVTTVRSNSTYSGSAKLCYYQVTNYSGDNSEIETTPNARAFLMKLVDKLPNQMGALEYSLTSAKISD